ncbi:hypothetical protein RclHR1_19310003 [Rhizophagus clarus]|uniref:Aldo/keto reductase n=1 Tax=Rhizophagus clarus TaxID=94130 RepID=A0A2Z6RHJ3_9GLOM|nr:hypothetical protein RclHR1_19310003 [Rhizophagus clarus]GES92203.1 aldo/keto reductase [Rhizophagus clarus]
MLFREFGKTGVKVSAIGLGCMGMSDCYGPADEQESINVLNRSIELGCTLWDTADMYGVGANEILLSKVLKERRDEVFLCTKCGIVREPSGELQCIDLYYQHRIDPNTPIEDTVGALAERVKEGKIKYIGLSECSAETLRRAYKFILLLPFNPWTLDIETNGIIEACRELGVTIVAYSPLGHGFLTGKYKSLDDFAPDDWRRTIPRFQGENFAMNLEIADKFNEFADKKGVAASQLCLAWVLAQGDNIIAIPGQKNEIFRRKSRNSKCSTYF